MKKRDYENKLQDLENSLSSLNQTNLEIKNQILQLTKQIDNQKNSTIKKTSSFQPSKEQSETIEVYYYYYCDNYYCLILFC